VVDHELDNYCRSSLVQILFWFFSSKSMPFDSMGL
jgi:hypothetical protein